MKSNETRRHFLGAWLTGGALACSTSPYAAAQVAKSPQGIFDVRAFGAVGDGQALDTKALQAAINAAASLGGIGLLPAGNLSFGNPVSQKPHFALPRGGCRAAR